MFKNKCEIALPNTRNKKIFQYDAETEDLKIISSIDFDQLTKDVVPVIRMHSSCFLSEQIGTSDCDCAEQLKSAVWFISNIADGIIFYVSQEGRGHGTSQKIKILDTMSKNNLNTVEACNYLNIPADVRQYAQIIKILNILNIKKVKLISNNPKKEEALTSSNISILETIHLPTLVRQENEQYLRSKQQSLNHKLNLPEDFKNSQKNTIRFYHPTAENGFFSNLSLHNIVIANQKWHTVEHFYKAQKFNDISINQEPAFDKMNRVELEGVIRKDWEEIKIAVMYTGLFIKFSTHSKLKEKLIATNDAMLIEKSTNNYFWGIGEAGSGQNQLGKLLMKIRMQLLKNS